MKALIYNSGLGKRMGELTKDKPKSLVTLSNGEAIFARQLRILRECGIKDIIVTTGPFKEKIEAVAKGFPDMHFTFVNNPVYDQTNYIYSMYCARESINDDMILLHGDLVFNKRLLKKVLESPEKDLITINRKKALPEKDFKGRIKDGKLQEVSINIFDEDCFALQPMYKLSLETLRKWVDKVVEFIDRGDNKVYAENAFNTILPSLSVREFSYEDDFIDEVDNPDDLKRVSSEIRLFDFREQALVEGLDKTIDIIKRENVKKVMVVADEKLFEIWPLKKLLEDNHIEYVLFSDFGSNPEYEKIVKGIDMFNDNNCDFIISLGGGSAIDTAKVIKLFHQLDYHNGIPKEYAFNGVKHLAIPTTAGTGSESTRYSVCYYNKVKQSITHDSIVPDYVILDSELLINLPSYQKKSTVMDALCQAIESYWSINSTIESQVYSEKAIEMILDNLDRYINNNDLLTTKKMLYASNLAGKAINITQTTAPHALSYKLTSLYGIAHGHAVALTLPEVWQFMAAHTDKCIDARGEEYFKRILAKLETIFGTSDKFRDIFRSMELSVPEAKDGDIEELTNSVNPTRLKNNPVPLDEETIASIYSKVLR